MGASLSAVAREGRLALAQERRVVPVRIRPQRPAVRALSTVRHVRPATKPGAPPSSLSGIGAPTASVWPWQSR